MRTTHRLFLAFISGTTVCFFFLTVLDHFSWAQLPGYLLCGAAFAVGVLLPWLDRDDRYALRIAGLVVISAASFYAAVFTAMEFRDPIMEPLLEQYIAASFVGLGVVLAAAPPLLRLGWNLRLFVAALLLAPIGGAAFHFLGERFPYSFVLAFATWHVMSFAVLQIGYSDPKTSSWWASTSSRLRASGAVLLTLPIAVALLDDLIALMLVNQLQARQGGTTVHESVDVHGFLDIRRRPILRRGCEQGCLAPVAAGRFAFHEYRTKEGRYEVFFVSDDDDPNCKRHGEAWSARYDPVFGTPRYPADGLCLTYRSNALPIARYGLTEDFDTVEILFGLYEINRWERRFVRLRDEVVVANSVYFTLSSRLLGNSFSEKESWDDFFDAVAPKPESRWQKPD